MRGLRHGSLAVAVASIALTLSCGALAQSSSTQAKDHVRAGLAYAERNKWDEASREFEEAYQLDPQLSTLFDVAQSRLQAKHYRDAAEAYRRLLASGAGLSPAQQKTAKEGLSTAVTHLSHLDLVSVEPGDVVELDGAAVDTRQTVDVDPGVHHVVVIRAGTRMAPRQFDADDGQRVRISLRDEAKSAAAGATTSAPPPPPAAAGPPIAGFLVGGAGIVVLGVGAVLGITALSRRSELADSCGAAHTCAKDDVDSARTRMAIADVTIGVGLVATAVGAYLVLTRPSASVSVVGGPAPGGGYAGLRTSFQ